MSDLSEDRKRQIRQEEEERLQRLKAEEEDYRRQVRQELEGTAPAKPSPARQAKARPVREPRAAKDKRPKIWASAVYALAGLGLAFYAYWQGFPIPGIDGPFRSSLSADAAGALSPVDKVDWDTSSINPGEWRVGDDGAVVIGSAPKPSEGPAERTAVKTTPTETRPSTGTASPTTEPGRTGIDGGKISFRIPDGWTVSESNDVRVIIAKTFAGSQIRAILTNVTDRALDGLGSVHAGHVQYIRDWIGAGLEIDDELTQTLENGLTMSVTVLVHPSAPNYYYGAFTVVSNGRGVWVTIDGPEDVPEDVDVELMGLMESLRLVR